MPIHIDQLTTEIVPEPEPSPGGSGTAPPKPWHLLEQTVEAQIAWIVRCARTAAGGFDD